MAADRHLAWAAAASLALAAAAIPVALASGTPGRGDAASHVAEVDWAAGELTAGRAPLWFPDANLGYAPLLSYQPAPLLVTAAVAALVRPVCDPGTVVGLLAALLWALLPLAWYQGARGIGLAPGAALATGLIAIAASDVDAFGFGLRSWAVTGLYSQLWAAPLVPLAIGAACRHARGETGPRAPALLLAALILCHPIHALWTILAAAVFIGAIEPRRLLRFAGPAAIAVAATACWWLPFLLTADAQGGLPWERTVAGGHGPAAAVGALLRGDLLDRGRAPWLGLLAAAGLVVAVRGWRRPEHRGLLVLTPIAFVLLSGLHRRLAGAGQIESIRFLPAAQSCAFLAAGLAVAAGLARLRSWRPLREPRRRRAAAALLAAAVAGHVLARAVITWRLLSPGAEPASIERLAAALAGTDGRVMTHRDLGTRTVLYANRLPYLAGRPTLLSTARGFHDTRATRYLLDFEASAAGLRLYGVGSVVARELPDPLPETVVLRWTDGEHHLLVPPGGVAMAHVVRAPFAVCGDRDAVAEALVWVVPRAFEHGVLPRVGGSGCAEEGAIDADRLPPDQAAAEILARAAAWSPPSSRLVDASPVDHRGFRALADIDGSDELVALSASHHPYWRASVDGEPARVVRLAPDLVAVPVPRGRHTIELRFVPPRWIGWLAGVTVLALLAWLTAPRWSGAVRFRGSR